MCWQLNFNLPWCNLSTALTLCIMETPKRVDPDEMQHAAFHQGLHFLLKLKQSSGTEIHHNLENSTCDPLKYTMGNPIIIVSICMGISIRFKSCFVRFYCSGERYTNYR